MWRVDRSAKGFIHKYVCVSGKLLVHKIKVFEVLFLQTFSKSPVFTHKAGSGRWMSAAQLRQNAKDPAFTAPLCCVAPVTC